MCPCAVFRVPVFGRLFSPRDILKNPTAATERLAHGDLEFIRLRPWPQIDKPKTRWKGKATWK